MKRHGFVIGPTYELIQLLIEPNQPSCAGRRRYAHPVGYRFLFLGTLVAIAREINT